MANTGITVNGQHYDSPEAMPPDVRRTYDEAMRSMGAALASGQGAASTQVFSGHAGAFGGSVVVNRTVTVNSRTVGGLGELPPEVRQQFEDALKGGAAKPHLGANVHVSLSVGGPQARAPEDASQGSTPVSLPIESSSLESTIRNIPVSLAILVLIGLALMVLLGR